MKTAKDLAREIQNEDTSVRKAANPKQGDAILGRKLREFRKANGLTVVVVSSEFGKVHSYVSNIEAGNALPSLRMLIKLAAFYEVALDDLAGHMVDDERSGVSGGGA